MSKKFEEWDLIGELGEKLVASVSKYQELKLALVHREIQRMSDDNGKVITWTAEKRDKLKAAWTKADDAEQESFTFEDQEVLVTYGRYLLEYLDYLFGEEAT